MSFAEAFALTVSPAVEGGFSIARNDPGNWTLGKVGGGVLLGTQYGISAAFLYALPYDDPYRNRSPKVLTLADCQAIYRANFWEIVEADQLAPPIAGLLFDAAVNQGQGWAPRCLQSALGVAVDGSIGPKTIAAARAANAAALHAEIARVRDERYRADPDWRVDGVGWSRRLMTVVAATAVFT